jgi:hypothetical protein
MSTLATGRATPAIKAMQFESFPWALIEGDFPCGSSSCKALTLERDEARIN